MSGTPEVFPVGGRVRERWHLRSFASSQEMAVEVAVLGALSALEETQLQLQLPSSLKSKLPFVAFAQFVACVA